MLYAMAAFQCMRCAGLARVREKCGDGWPSGGRPGGVPIRRERALPTADLVGDVHVCRAADPYHDDEDAGAHNHVHRVHRSHRAAARWRTELSKSDVGIFLPPKSYLFFNC